MTATNVSAKPKVSDHAIGGPAMRCDAIMRRAGKNARGVEVGVFRGALSDRLLKAGVARLFMVDNWLTQDKQPEHYKATLDYHAHLEGKDVGRDREKAFIVARRHRGKAMVLEMDSVSAAHGIDDASMDFVFLDADHSYEGLRQDIEAWLPKVKHGGWIGGHDYDNDSTECDFTGVRRAVDEAFGDRVELDKNYTWFVQCG